MKKIIPAITAKTFNYFIYRLIDVIKRQESGSVLNLSNREQLWRINQLLQDKKLLLKFNPCQIIIINLASLAIEDHSEFDNYLAGKRDQNKSRFCLFILNADQLLGWKKNLLAYLNMLPHNNPNYSIIFFFQKNIFLSQFSSKLSCFSVIYQNIFFYPYYTKPDQEQFINYLQQKFKINLPVKIKKQIMVKCSGHLWLTKETVRYFAKTLDQSKLFNHEEMLMRLEIMVEEFEQIEKQVLEKITLKAINFNKVEQKVIDYFLKVNLIESDDFGYQISIPLLHDFIKNELNSKTTIKLNENNEITINGLLVEGFFSRKESYFLKYLINHPHIIISRNKTGEIIWDDHNYSDWALDQFIRRLRNKFSKIGLERQLISTKKNQGFIFKQG